MDKFVDWWKRDKRYVTLIKSVLLAVLPVLCCVVYCAGQGRTLGQVYLPGSEWNDELFYYKQVEGIIHFGYPQGYFGFNESHALKLSFAAWSPVLVFPWVMWGLAFGWNLMSPIVCNIVLMTLCCFLFVWLVKPDWRQLGILSLLFCLFRLFVRYMLSGMPEIICFVMLILFYGLAVNYLNSQKTWKLALLLVMGSVMALMRPYLLLFLLLPMYFWVRRNRWKGVLGSALVLFLTVLLYVCINHYLGAEYFEPLFFTDWITAFFESGIFGGLRFTLNKLHYMGVSFLQYVVESFDSGTAAGAFFSGYLVTLFILLYQSIADYLKFWRDKFGRRALSNIELMSAETGKGDKKENKLLIIEVHMLFSFVAMLFALLLMYKLEEGSKHLLTFIAAGIFVVSLMETKFFKKTVLLGVAFVFFYSYKAVSAYDYQVPFVTEERQIQMENWTSALNENLSLSDGEAPSFDNVVIWVFNDDIEDGVKVTTSWQLLYGLPKGFGISCCKQEYVIENFELLQSQYLISPSGGRIDLLCREADYWEVYRDEDTVLYSREMPLEQ